MKYTMQLISRDELKRKLERKDQFKLVMALGTWEYRAKHIPGSLHFLTLQDARASLAQDDEIVVYCSNDACSASVIAYEYLVRHATRMCAAMRVAFSTGRRLAIPSRGRWWLKRPTKQDEGGDR